MKPDEKIDNILDAANKRFAHFGVDKTTMNEIADDLGISKASLYYYFPDKLNLYAAVLKRIILAEQGVELPYINENNLQRGMHKYLEKRMEFIIHNFRILEYLRNMAGSIPDELKELFNEAKGRDLRVITAFLKKGKDEGLLNISNLRRTTELLHDSLTGLRIIFFSGKAPFFTGELQFNELLSREKELVDVFFKAMS